MKIDPAVPIIKNELSEDELNNYRQKGIEFIKQGKVAVCTMAGGQGTRLGYNGPKGTFIVPFTQTNPKSIFEIDSDLFKEVYKKYGVWPKWYIMTSKDNDNDTRMFFEVNDYFGMPEDTIIFFIQGEFPLLKEDGTEIIDESGNIVTAANGNGGIFKALDDEGILQDMENNNIEYLVACNVDNILINPLDEVTIGLLALEESDLGIKSIARRYASERVGSIVYKDGKVSIVEYIEMPKELSEAVDEHGNLIYADSHLVCNYISLELLKRIAKETLPIHEAHKENDKYGKHIKQEMFIFDGFEKANNPKVIRVKREDEFAPIKNKEGNDSPETAVALFQEFYNL